MGGVRVWWRVMGSLAGGCETDCVAEGGGVGASGWQVEGQWMAG